MDIYSQWAQVEQVAFQLGTVVHLHTWKGEQLFQGRYKYFTVVQKYLFQGERILRESNFNVTYLPVFVNLIYDPDLVLHILPEQKAVNVRCKLQQLLKSVPKGYHNCQLMRVYDCVGSFITILQREAWDTFDNFTIFSLKCGCFWDDISR